MALLEGSTAAALRRNTKEAKAKAAKAKDAALRWVLWATTTTTRLSLLNPL